MSPDIALILSIDGIATGSIYLLAGLGFVLIFSVTRVIFIPFGDMAAFSALTLAAFQTGATPGSIWLIMVLAVAACCMESLSLLRAGTAHLVPKALFFYGILPLVPCLVGLLIAGREAPDLVRIAVTLGIILPLGVLVDRLALRPIADASTLILFVVALAVHFLLSGVGLMIFGPEGARTTPLIGGALSLPGGVVVPAQQLLMVLSAAALSLLFYLFFGRSITGKALRATASNRVGARLMGIRPTRTAVTAYLIASALAGIVGVLIAPVTTMYYDSGFMIGLKASVGAIVGGMASYPITAIGSLFVGLVESFSSFVASAYKEILIFSIVIPVLIWRSLATHRGDEETEELV